MLLQWNEDNDGRNKNNTSRGAPTRPVITEHTEGELARVKAWA